MKWIKKLGDYIEGALMDGQNQIHDLFAKRATDEEITKRMQESFKFHLDKSIALIKAEVVEKLIEESVRPWRNLYPVQAKKSKQQLRDKWL